MNKISTIRTIAPITLFLILFAVFCYSGFGEEYTYHLKSRGEQKDIVKFMKIRSRLSGRIRERERIDANFAVGEYYFKEKILLDAKATFGNLAKQNPADIRTLLANIYLYKFAKISNKLEKIDTIKKEIFKRQFVLLFDEFKTLNYTSLFENEYEIKYYVDKIEVNLNGNSFEEIKP